MAQPITARPGKMRILLGDGATPTEAFEAPCGLTTKGLTISKNLAEVSIPDCDDPDAPFWMARDVESMSASISGDGVMAAESEEVWNDAAFSTESINAKVEIEFSTGTRTFSGAFHIDSYGVNAQQGQRVSASISMQSDGIIDSEWDATPVSRDGFVDLDFGDGEHHFRLAEGELMKLEEECDAGPGWVLERMSVATAENKGWRIGDIRAVIRLGLVGGGLDAIKARRLVDEYLPKSPPYENLVKAQAILGSALIWPEGELKEKKAPEQPGASEESGTGQPSSESARRSA